MHWQFCAQHFSEKSLEHRGKGKFKTYTAGSHPNGIVNPFTIPIASLHSMRIKKEIDEIGQLRD